MFVVGDPLLELHAYAIGRAGHDETDALVGQLRHVLGVLEVDAGDVGFGHLDFLRGLLFALGQKPVHLCLGFFGGQVVVGDPLCHPDLDFFRRQSVELAAMLGGKLAFMNLLLNGLGQVQQIELQGYVAFYVVAHQFKITAGIIEGFLHVLDVPGDLDDAEPLPLLIFHIGKMSGVGVADTFLDEAGDGFPTDLLECLQPPGTIDHPELSGFDLIDQKRFLDSDPPQGAHKAIKVADVGAGVMVGKIKTTI